MEDKKDTGLPRYGATAYGGSRDERKLLLSVQDDGESLVGRAAEYL